MICMVRDIPIYYEEYGSGKAILCIHGYSVDHRLMSGCLEPVFNQTQGYRRIYLDLPGMGKTPSQKWIKSSDDMLEILNEFITAVIPDGSFLIAGESYGGYLTLGLIHDIRDRIDGVLLICPMLKSWVIMNDEKEKLPKKQVLWKSETLGSVEDNPDIKSFLDFAVIATPEIFEKYKNDILSGVMLSDKDFLYNYFDGAYNINFENSLKTNTYNKPACILTGRQDNAVGYSDAYEILDRFPRATLAVLDCAGHNLQIDSEPLFSQHVKDWLWRVELT